MDSFQVDSGRRLEAVDITDRVERIVASTGVKAGIAVISVSHTTVGLIVNEFVPDLMRDLEHWVRRTVPRDDDYDHPANADSHLRAAMFGSSVTLPIAGGRLALGTWQRVILLEFDGPRRRTVSLQTVGA